MQFRTSRWRVPSTAPTPASSSRSQRLFTSQATIMPDPELAEAISPEERPDIFSAKLEVPAILRLPNELLEVIASFVVTHQEVNVMEGLSFAALRTPGSQYFDMTVASPSSTAHKLSLEGVNARNLALVCRHFRAIVEQTMYTHITLPQSTNVVQHDYARSPLVYLVRTLLDRPHLARRIKSLHVWVRDRRLVRDQHERNYPPENPHSETFQRALAYLSKFGLSFKDLFNWSTAMYEHQELALHAFLIALLPNLRELKLFAPMARVYQLTDLGDHEMCMETKYSYLDVALQNSSITSAYIGGPFPIEILPPATLTTLELDIVFFGDRVDLMQTPLVLPNVHTVSIVVNLRVLRSETFEIICTELGPRTGLLLFLRKVTPNVMHFKVAAPSGFMPYFNDSENLVDAWGRELPSEVDIEQEPVDIELSPLFNHLTDDNVWAWMLEALESKKKQLKTLTLPKNWHSPQGHAKPIPSLEHFSALEMLILPRVAVISNPQYHPEQQEIPATEFLPKTIKTLVISNVDTRTCTWVQKAFKHQGIFPDLKEVGLIFDDGFVPVLPEKFVDDAWDADVEVRAQWRGMEELIVGRGM